MAVAGPFGMVLLVALLSLGARSAAAEEAAEKDPFGGRLVPLELVMSQRNEIGLTSEQNRRIGELVVQVQQAVAGKRWEMQTAYFDLMAVLDEPEVDEERAVALAGAAVSAENEIKLEQLRLLIRVRNLLSEEQVATLRAHMNEQAGRSAP